MLFNAFVLALLAPFVAGILVGAITALAGSKIPNLKNPLWILAVVGNFWVPDEWQLSVLGGVGVGFLVVSPNSWTLVAPVWGVAALTLSRLERGLDFPFPSLAILVCGGAIVAWLSQSAARKADPWWALAAVLSGAMASNLVAQGLGVACFTLGLAAFLWFSSKPDTSDNTRDEIWRERLEMVLALACGLTFFQVFSGVRPASTVPFDSFVALAGGVAGVLIAATGASLSRFAATLVALLGPLVLGAIWGARLELGLFLGAILGAVFGDGSHTWTALLALLAMICLWPLALELSSAARIERVAWVCGVGALCILAEVFMRRKNA